MMGLTRMVWCDVVKRRITKDECIGMNADRRMGLKFDTGHGCPMWNICWMWMGHHSRREV